MKIKRLIFILLLTMLIILGIIFQEEIRIYLWGLSWNKGFSMAVLVAGSVYAIIERNFIIGLVAFAASLLLPWIQTWLSAYWPWFKANCAFLPFH